MTELLLRGGRPWTPGGELVAADLHIVDGRIAAVGPDLSAPEAETVDLDGALILPGLVDAHCHVDKTTWGAPWTSNPGGATLAERIANSERRRTALGIPSAEYAGNLLDTMVAGGTSHARSHVDIDPVLGLSGVEAVRAASQRHAGRIDVELVAFPQGGFVNRAGVRELMTEALAGGVEVIGGLDPAGYDNDPAGQLDVIFHLAERFGAKIDIHLHDGGTMGIWEFGLIIERTRALGMTGRVTISHAYALGQQPEDEQRRIADKLADAGVALVTCAVTESPVVPVKIMHAAGATMGLGNDGVRDLWAPYGDGDMLRRVGIVASRAKLVADADIELALAAGTYGGARILGVEDYGLAVGSKADFFVVDAPTPAAAVVGAPPRKLVVKGGRVVAGTEDRALVRG
ncbi:amidohydrolase [Nocardia neocaledoniensis]|uniref:amidohydrolase n=1 Tax=Nocardia neocaledoniensis TaxID=236511 RepID=UPI00245658F7|nr:amidohydrolase [Nocardia neocaledoniensis]